MTNFQKSYFDPINSIFSINDDRTRFRSRSRSPINKSQYRPRDDFEYYQKIHKTKITCASNRLFITNIPYKIQWQDLKDLFMKEVGGVCYVNLPEDSSGKILGYGMIEFKDIETAQAAINKMNRFEIRGRKIIIREETIKDKQHLQKLKEQHKEQCKKNISKPVINLDFVNSKLDTKGITPEILQNLGINGPVIDKIFVSNLDHKVNLKKFREVFEIAGKIVSLELMKDKDENMCGMGTVQYETALEACQAISMFNNQMLYDHIMSVKMYKLPEPFDNSKRLPFGLKGIGEPLDLKNKLTSLSNYSNDSNLSRNCSYNYHSISPKKSSINEFRFSPSSEFPCNSVNPASLLCDFTEKKNILANLGTSDFMKNISMGIGNNYYLSSDDTRRNKYNKLDCIDPIIGERSNINNLKVSNEYNVLENKRNKNKKLDCINPITRERLNTNNLMVHHEQQFNDLNDNRIHETTNTVFVNNLPFKITWQKLKDRFKQCGNVQFAKIKTENGGSNSFGVVRFKNHKSAEKAIEKFNGMVFDGRHIEVGYDYLKRF